MADYRRELRWRVISTMIAERDSAVSGDRRVMSRPDPDRRPSRSRLETLTERQSPGARLSEAGPCDRGNPCPRCRGRRADSQGRMDQSMRPGYPPLVSQRLTIQGLGYPGPGQGSRYDRPRALILARVGLHRRMRETSSWRSRGRHRAVRVAAFAVRVGAIVQCGRVRRGVRGASWRAGGFIVRCVSLPLGWLEACCPNEGGADEKAHPASHAGN